MGARLGVRHRVWRRARGLVILAIATSLAAGCTGAGRELPSRHMIAAANPHAARAGLDILRAGGSAVDATIAAQMVLTLVEPQSSGIGGGAFMLHYRPGRAGGGIAPTLDAYDGRETAPMGATPTLFMDPDGKPYTFRNRIFGGAPVGVPGVLRMLEMAHRKHGKLPWRDLFQRAIRLAEDGFEISPRLHLLIRRARTLGDFPAARAYFFTAAGKAKPVGARLRNPALADTLRRIAEGGADAFYTGAIAADIAAAVRRAPRRPATMTVADLEAYRAKARGIICRPYRVWRVCVMGPPTSGGIATLQILAMLERFDLARIAPGSVQAVHLISEASRLAYADRDLYVADSDFVTVPVLGLLDRAYLGNRARLISAARSMGRAAAGILPGRVGVSQAPDVAPKPVSTSHISVVDRWGNAVSMTTSVGTAFGSGLMVRGFMLNSQIADFSARPEIDGRPVANRVAPGKRPRSSMSPTLVLDGEGRLVMAVGSPGGSRIIGYVARTLIAALDWDLPMQQAVALPNHVNRNRTTDLEKGTALEALRAELAALGHEVRIRRLTSGLHGIRVRANGFDGGADPRREGVAIGD